MSTPEYVIFRWFHTTLRCVVCYISPNMWSIYACPTRSSDVRSSILIVGVKLGSNTNSPCVDMALGNLTFTYNRKRGNFSRLPGRIALNSRWLSHEVESPREVRQP